MGTVSEVHHGITRQGDGVYIPKMAGDSWDVRFDLSSGLLDAPVTPNPNSQNIFRDALGGLDGTGDVHVDGSNFRTSPLFELERMMAEPLTQLDLVQIEDDARREIMHHYTTQAREKLAAFFAKYRESVEASKLGKPRVERYFREVQHMSYPDTEMLQKIFGGQLLKTLQEAYKKR